MSAAYYGHSLGVSARQNHLRMEKGTSIRRPKSAQLYSAHKKTKPYKIIYEQVSEVKQSLRTHTTSKPRMRGYTFVPSGNPKLTKWCQDYCSKNGILVYPVNLSSREHQDPNHITSHTHRVGIQFPEHVVQQACAVLKIDRIPTRMEQTDSGDLSYHEIAAAIKEHFPRIPDDNIDLVIRRAWSTLARPQVNTHDGSNNRQELRLRVGDARDLTLGRKVQLAVAAHIRHEYTNYDYLLSTGTYNRKEARNAIQPQYVQKVAEWRGEDGKASVEDMFREIIEILDEDEDDTQRDDQTIPEVIDLATDSDDNDDITYRGSTSDLRRTQYRTWRQSLVRPQAQNSGSVHHFKTDEHRRRFESSQAHIVQDRSGQLHQLVESSEGSITLIPLYPRDAYSLDRAPRFDQIKDDLHNTEVIPRNVDWNSRPLDHIELVTRSQHIASPDIAVPSVECGSVYRSPEYPTVTIQAPQPITSSVHRIPQRIEVAANQMASAGFYEPQPTVVRIN